MPTTPTALVWLPPQPFASYTAQARERAEQRRAAVAVYFAGMRRGLGSLAAIEGARVAFAEASGATCSKRTLFNWIARVESRGGLAAPIEAYCSERQVRHDRAPSVEPENPVPGSFLAALRQKAQERGTGSWRAAVRHFQIMWRAGAEIPGLGLPGARARFPFTLRQLAAAEQLQAEEAR